jgi:NAD(P)H-dependent flavin oxidoreductase YrpB (nitropropane dioxygenase family)
VFETKACDLQISALEEDLFSSQSLGGGTRSRGGKATDFEKLSMLASKGSKKLSATLAAMTLTPLLELTILANFSEVFLAKLGHQGLIGINLLEKIQLPHLPSLFGAMLAGVDYVLMGAGIPRQIPAALDSLAKLQETHYRLDVAGAQSGETYVTKFDPKTLADWPMDELKRPQFLAIISSSVLATTLLKKITPPVDGFIVKESLAAQGSFTSFLDTLMPKPPFNKCINFGKQVLKWCVSL